MTPQEIERKAAERVSAVVPLTQVAMEDVSRGAQVVDKWLQDVSGGYVTLDVLKNVAGSMPIVGNIMAVVDVLCDIVHLVRDKAADEIETFFNWVSLGINLIGIIPLPPSMAAARMGLRPTLHLVRQELKHAASGLGDAIVSLLIGHLNARIAGEIDTYIDGAIAKLSGMLEQGADKGEALVHGWSHGLRRIAAGEVFKVGPPAERPLHDPQSKYANVFSAAWGALKAAARTTVNKVAGAALRNTHVAQVLNHSADQLAAVGSQFKARLKAQANAQTQKSIAWLLARLKQAVVRYLTKHKIGSAPTINHRTVAKSEKKRGDGLLEATRHQAPVKGDPNCCKATGGGRAPAAQGGTGHSLSFATGSETVVHTDFALPGHMPIVWARTYYSRLGAFDHPREPASKTAAPAYLGARWTTPYTTRIDQSADGRLHYLAADGRAHTFPALAGPGEVPGSTVGQSHHDAVEDLTLSRGNDGLLILSHGRDLVETFELVPQFLRHGQPHTRGRAVHYRLTSQRTRAGHLTELAYRHEGGQLSDITSGDSHVCTAIDEQGRIHSVWLVQEGQAVRQLAAYTYAEQPDGSSDLVAAEDEDGQRWTYDYLATSAKPGADRSPSTHLLRHYSDRTGRGIHLHWMHEEGFAHAITPGNSARAKAWREHADDGSFDTTVVFNRHIRLTTVIDALGYEREYYFDIRGHVYRVVHPEIQGADGLFYRHQEWFFRDAQANITRHLHADGSCDDYAYDTRGNLVRHSRPDGSVVHFAYDAQDNLTGIRDGEGHAWRRAYDGMHLVEEVDPLGHTTRYENNAHGLPVSITDAKGGKKTLAYDSAGQLVAYTDCSGKTSRWAYDPRGRLIEARNAAGETTRYLYERGQLVQTVLPDGTREHYEHDAEGRLLLHRDALQRETRYEWNEAGLIGQRIDAAGQTLGYSWDRLGRLVALRNENGRVHRFGYDRLGRLRAEEHFDVSVTEYGYDSASTTLAWVREADALTELGFDPVGRLTLRRASLWALPKNQVGQPIEGRPLQQTPDSVREATYAYDGNGRLVDARNSHIHLQWFYDAAGNMVAEHQHHRTSRDAQPLSQPRTAVWRHRYDALGHRIHTTRPDGHRLDWLTYGSGHVHGLMLDELEVLQIERDDLHREVRRTQANRIAEQRQYDPAGRLQAQLLSRAERLGQRPDSLQRLPISLTPGQDGPASAFNLQRRYTYDAAGQLTGIADSLRGNLSYRYDPVGRLLRAHSRLGEEVFAFDPASNMLDLPPQPEDEGLALSTAPSPRLDPATAARRLPPILDNLLKDYAGTHYDWDARGNLIRRRHNGEVIRFGWNAANELEEVVRNGTVRTRYWYDPLGRRLGKFSEPIVHVPPMAGSRYGASEYARRAKEEGLGGVLYGWDGDQLAWETDYVRLQTLHYVHEPHSFVPLLQATTMVDMVGAMLQRPHDVAGEYQGADGYDMERDPLHNGSWHPGLDEHGELKAPFTRLYYYQCDHLGTPQALTDEQGEIAWEANYRAWGQASIVIQEAARKAGLCNHIRFQGQYFDEESGLHYNRYRYYDPHSGRFVSRDPIGLLGGVNTHAYAPNPTLWVDPWGLIGRRGAFRQAKRDAGIPMRQHPDFSQKVPLSDRNCTCEMQRVNTTEYVFTRSDNSKVVIQDHGAGHKFGENGIGDQGAHFNVRPIENTRTGSVPGTKKHYPFE